MIGLSNVDSALCEVRNGAEEPWSLKGLGRVCILFYSGRKAIILLQRTGIEPAYPILYFSLTNL